MVGAHVDPAAGSLMKGYRVVSFRVPLAHREKQLSFKIGNTVAEEDGCVKVKMAEDEGGNPFYMKLILRSELDKIADDGVRERLNTEIGVLKILDHKHIVKLFQVFSSDEIVFLLMERVAVPLSQRIQEGGGRLSEAAARSYFQQLLGAISYLHGRGLVHRDLCADHVMIDSDTDWIKIIYFGVSCLQSSRDLLRDHPPADPLYAAPELLGTEPYHGKKADIWSLGCLLHLMLTGAPPYAAGVQPGPAEVLPVAGASAPARRLVQRMLNVDWKERINLNDLVRDPWVTDGGDPRIPPPQDSFVGPAGRRQMQSAEELEMSTSQQLQASFAKLEGLQLATSLAATATTPLKTPKSPDSVDVVDDTFSPLKKGRQRRPFALLDTPLGAHKEIEPLWAEGGGGPSELQIGPPPMLELSPRAQQVSSPSARTRRMLCVDILSAALSAEAGHACDSQFEASPMHKRANASFSEHVPGLSLGTSAAGAPVPAVDGPRQELAGMTAPGVVTDHDLAAAAAQRITAARFQHYAATREVYPTHYPPPEAGTGSDVFRAADEGGEGKCTRKEIAKYLMRNQTLRHRLREGWPTFNSNFGTEDTPENHEELDERQFCALWAAAAAMRKE